MLGLVITPEIVAKSLSSATTQLQNYYQSIDVDSLKDLKLMNEYMKWVKRKTELLEMEKNFKMPCTVVPNKISKHTYDWLIPEKQLIIDKYYKFDNLTNEYIVSVKKSDIAYNDLEIIINTILLKRGNVVWVEFGYNIGCEFGGKHPAVILKSTKDALFVIPVSSQSPNNLESSIHVEIPKIYGFTSRKRWVNILNKNCISLLRVDFSSPIGNIKRDVLDEIGNAIVANNIK